MRGWMLLFATLTAALGVALALEQRENRRLRGDLVALTAAQARAAGLEPGQALAPVTLHDASGQDVRLDFTGGSPGTVLLFHSSACDACAISSAHWRSAIAQAARPDVRVLCIQTDGANGAPLWLDGLPASLAVPLPPVGWLAEVPAVPATLVLDGGGVVVRAWYGELDAGIEQELARTIAESGASGGVTSRQEHRAVWLSYLEGMEREHDLLVAFAGRVAYELPAYSSTLRAPGSPWSGI